ncbi:MAG: hypothetical protein JWM82_1307, partial [Myxococcales bacterium]|nr:hypothetical protein [Myxococcales bacterium]
MTDLPSMDAARPAIVDLVFAGEPDGGRRRVAFGGLLVVAIYTAGFIAVSHSGRSAGPWSAEVAARIHDAIATERAIDVSPPPPTPPPTPAPESPTLQATRVARA